MYLFCMSTNVWLIGIIFLFSNMSDLQTAIHIASTPCDILLAEGLEGIHDQETCQLAKDMSANIIYFFYYSVTVPLIDIASYFAIINKFNTPFLTRKPSHLFVLIIKNKVIFKEIKESKPFVVYKSCMYLLDKGIEGSFNNIYHIFVEGNNQEITYQYRNIEKLKTLIVASYGHKDDMIQKINHTFKFLIRISKLQLVRHWNMVIYQDYVDIQPSHMKGIKSIASLKSMNVYFVYQTQRQRDVGVGVGNGNSSSRFAYYQTALEQKESAQAILVDLLQLKTTANMNAYLMYKLYKHMKELQSMKDDLVGNKKIPVWVFLAGIAVIAVFLFMTYFKP